MRPGRPWWRVRRCPASRKGAEHRRRTVAPGHHRQAGMKRGGQGRGEERTSTPHGEDAHICLLCARGVPRRHWSKCEKAKWIRTVQKMNRFSWYLTSTNVVRKQVTFLQLVTLAQYVTVWYGTCSILEHPQEDSRGVCPWFVLHRVFCLLLLSFCY